MNTLRWLDAVVIIVYMLGVLAIGLRFARRQTSTEHYFVAKRSIPAWAMGVSMFATLISSITFIAYPGAAYAGNWAELVAGFMVVIVLVLVGAVIVPFFRHAVRMSAYEYFERRFGYSVRAYTAVGFAVGHFSKMGFVFYLVALTLNSITGWDLAVIIIVGGAVTVAYTYMGGLEAVIWTDVTQGIVLFLGLTISLLYLLFLPPGGPGAAFELISAQNKIDFGSTDFDLSKKGVWAVSLYGLFWYLQKYTADQTIVQRYLVAKSDREAIRGVALGAVLCVPVWAMFLLVGSLTWAFFQLSGDPLPAHVIKADQVFPYFLTAYIPAGLAGIIMAALFSAAMSTISSDLNCLAVIGVEDFYRQVRRDTTDRERLMAGKIIVAIAGLLCVVAALLLATTAGTALTLYFTVTSIVAGGLFGVFFLAFMCTRVNAASVWLGIAACLLFTAYATLSSGSNPVMNLGTWNYSWNSIMIGVVGHVLVIVVGYSASFLFKHPQDGTRAMTYWGWRERKTAAPDPALPVAQEKYDGSIIDR
jgi:solute:Na+ symporter, SSS family